MNTARYCRWFLLLVLWLLVFPAVKGLAALPVITMQPANQIAREGDTVWFAVAATNSPPFTCQWMSNAVAIAGATSTNYTTPPVVSGMNGMVYSVVVSNSSGGVTSSNATLRVLPALGRQLVFSDEFDGATLDTTEWTQEGDVSRQQGYWYKNDSYLNGQGQLVLRVQKDPTTGNYGSGAIHGKLKRAFGYYEAKYKFFTQQGHWCAFWVYSDSEGSTNVIGGSDGAEMDVMEKAFLTDHMDEALYWDGYSPGPLAGTVGNTVRNVGLADGGWHIFGMDWTPTNYSFYVDGALMWSTNAGGVSQVPSYARLSEEIGNFGTGPDVWGTGPITNAVLPDFTFVEYCRIYETNLNGAPLITTQPQDQTVVQGSNAIFSVVASGDATLSYQWRLNGAAISGATASSYTNVDTQPSDAGSYTVMVTNAAGGATSSNALLTVIMPPSITTQPQSQTVNQGDAVLFSVTAAGTVPLSYQWKFNGTNITGATGSSYTKVNTQPFGAGNYSVVVTNIAGSLTSSNAGLMVNAVTGPPAITTQPQSQTVNQDGSVTFYAGATGTTPLSYQWQFNETNVSGATGDSYSKANVQTSDEGNYSVVVTNLSGGVTSSNAVLTVNILSAPTAVYDFNNGLPAGTILQTNNSVLGVTNAGGYTNSGCMVLTRPITCYGQWCITNDLAGGAAVSNFNVSFQFYMGHGSGGNAPVPNPGGNGLVFHVGPTPPGQNTGSGSSWGNGLDVTFRVYNSPPNTPGVNIEYNQVTNNFNKAGAGTMVATTNFLGFFQTNGASDNFSEAVNVSVVLSNGMLNVSVAPTNGVGTNVCNNLVIPNFVPISPGTMAWTASSGAGAFEDAWIDNVTIAVNPGAGSGNVPPSITAQPQNASVPAGMSAAFTVTVTNTAATPISYQWWKVVPGVSTNLAGSAGGGAFVNAYTTPVLGGADSGAQYFVVVSNVVNLVTSSMATVTVPPAQFSPPALFNGTNLVLNWSGGGMLESATNVTGPWMVVTNAVNPFTNPIDPNLPQQFFRVQQ